MTQISKLTKALLEGKITEANEIANDMLLAKCIDKIDELVVKKKFAFRSNGKGAAKRVKVDVRAKKTGFKKIKGTKIRIKKTAGAIAAGKKSSIKRVRSAKKTKVRSAAKRKRTLKMVNR